MNIGQALTWASQQLKNKKIQSSALDAEVLLAHVLKTTKEKIYTRPEKQLTNLQLKTYKLLIRRRAKREPVAYLTGHKEFYGLDFLVNKKVLIPRPETELMVDEILRLITPTPPPYLKGELEGVTIIDVGTGSGCIIIAMAKSLMSLRATAGSVAIPYFNGIASSSDDRRSPRNDNPVKFFATDISPAALNLARQNARRHGVEKQIKFLQGNLLQPFIHKIPLNPPLSKGDARGISQKNCQLIITANLPYLPTAEWRRTPPDVKNYEPRLALDGGPNGLKYYRQLFQQYKKNCYMLHAICYMFLEICPHQADAITKLAQKYFSKCQIKIKKDPAGHDRLIIINVR